MAVIEKFQQKHWLGPVKRACDRLRERHRTHGQSPTSARAFYFPFNKLCPPAGRLHPRLCYLGD